MTSPAARLVDRAIDTYQRRLSPRKGYTCAHLVARGGRSCSAEIRDVVRRRGVVRALRPSVLQFVACAQAASLLADGGVQGVCCCGGIPIPFRF